MLALLKKTITTILLVTLVVNCMSLTSTTHDIAGYNTLFIGHSFFRPVADGMPTHANRVGVTAHKQQIVFSGGASGSPQGLWENTNKRAEIQTILDNGDIDLLGMTYHTDHPGISGYTNWVAYALQQNPETKFFIALPWLYNPGDFNSATYASNWTINHPLITHGHINTLRTIYSNNDFYCIPYGEAAGELYKLYEAGNLTDVQSLVRQGESPGIFSDSFGHADDILVDLSQLVWLAAIYGVDLITYNYDPGYIIDLKMMAANIMTRHEPAYNAGCF